MGDVFKKIKNNDIRLETLKFKNADDLRLNCERRYAEVELGFVEGFWGGKSDLKIPEYLAQLIDSVSELAGIYNTLAKKLEQRCRYVRNCKDTRAYRCDGRKIGLFHY